MAAEHEGRRKAHVLSNVIGMGNKKASDKTTLRCLTHRTGGDSGKTFYEFYGHILRAEEKVLLPGQWFVCHVIHRSSLTAHAGCINLPSSSEFLLSRV